VPRAFDAMRDAVSPRGIPVLVALFPAYLNFERFEDYPYVKLHAQIEAAARGRGFDTLDLVPAYRASGRGASAVKLDLEHPNEIGDDIAARAILAKIEADRERLWPEKRPENPASDGQR
jgi:hypothetical protein